MSYTEQSNVVSDRVMSVTEAAYVAGILDGEGHIALSPRTSKRGTGHHTTAFTKVSNTNLDLLNYLVKVTGNGRIVARTVRQVRQKQCYDWTLTTNQIRHVLPQVLPYLIARKRQAECVLRYLELVQGRLMVAPENVAEVVALCDEVRVLNARGGQTAEEIRENLLEITRRCKEPGCLQRPYRDLEWCYPHWLANRKPAEGACEYCGGPMHILLAHKRFCSQKCQLASYRDKVIRPKAEAVKANVEPGICPECGETFDRKHYKGKQYCSAACYQKMANRNRSQRHTPKEHPERMCDHCGGAFRPALKSQIYCGASCRYAAYYRRKQQLIE